MMQHYDTIFNSINEGVFTIDMNRRITAFNHAAERITGVSREEAIGLFCSEVFRTNICENACPLRETIETGKPVVNAIGYIVNSEGKQIPISISTALLKNPKGDIVGGVETFQDISQIEQLRKELKERYSFEDIIGRSNTMIQLFKILPQLAESDSTVLIEGSSGTGKELFAHAIHNLSHRKKNRFVAINCGAIPDTLLESELFGYKAGAFTDARKEKPGRFSIANHGTLFLDEIGDISPAMQVRLLRVIQEKCFEPLGSIDTIHVDVRIVAATNKNLAKLVQEGLFREDLYYRIRVLHLILPDLKERKEDIPFLIDHFITKLNRIKGRNIAGVSKNVLAKLMEYDFPGNIRELENIIEHAFVLCNGSLIELGHLPIEFRPDHKTIVQEELKFAKTLKSMEKVLIEESLKRHNGNRTLVAMELGINKSTLYRKIKSLEIMAPDTDGRSGLE